MMLRAGLAALLGAALLGSGCGRDASGRAAGAFDLTAALDRLTNVAAFADAPAGAAGLITSYDRSGGNSDWFNLAQRKAGEDLYVLADLKGPGCVRRLWMTNVPAKEWLLFFDGERTPRIRCGRLDLFGQADPFLPPLCQSLSGGEYCYVPMPYAKSLRIAIRVPELKPDMRPYFHVNYETFPAGTKVVSFPAALSAAEQERLAAARREWGGMRDAARAAAAACTEQPRRETVAPGASLTWLEAAGPARVDAFRIAVRPPAGASEVARTRLLRELVLRIFWDGREEPSIEAPLGDFFCNGQFPREFAAMPLAVLPEGFVCRLPMPFAGSARAEIRNDSAMPVEIEAAWRRGPPATGPARYLHACWGASKSTGLPHRILKAEGAGHYVGCYLIAIGMDGGWNMLEGDESIRVGGELSPSMHGTGLEDYFNGGWYYQGLFERPFHGLLEKTAVATAQYRLHGPDPVEFTNGISVNIEFGDGNRARGFMSSVAYWYQAQPAPAGGRIPPPAERFPPADPLEPANIMSRLYELERAGRYAEAAQRCRYFAEVFASHEAGPLLALRGLAYRERLEGFEAVRPGYEAAAAGAPESRPARQAQDLLWFHGGRDRALVGANNNGAYRFYIDGQPVGQGDSPVDLSVWRATLAPGPHELTVELTPTRRDPWVSMCVRMHGTNIWSDPEWEYAATKPASWPRTDGAEWKPVLPNMSFFPMMAWWQFVPNAYIDMQGREQLIYPAPMGAEKPSYLRRRFTVPPPVE